MSGERPSGDDPPFNVDDAFRARYDFGRSQPLTNTIVSAVADATGVDPFELPPLNERIDASALDRFVDAEAEKPAGTATAVVFPMLDRLVSVTRDGRVAVSNRLDGEITNAEDVFDLGSSPDGYTVEHEEQSNEERSTTLVRAIASVTGIKPVGVHERLDGIVDLRAVNALFRARANGTPRAIGGIRFPFQEYEVTVLADGTISLRSTLMGLKQTGGNLLLVGSVPDDVITAASAPLLGTDEIGRVRLFTLYETTVETARERLSEPGNAHSGAHVINCQVGARSTAIQNAPTEFSVSDAGGTLDELPAAIADAIERIERDRDGFDPAELRFCFDSLDSLVRSHDYEDVTAVLESVCGSVDRVSGMGHYVLPVERDSEPVRALEPLFDAVIELRVSTDGPEQRWHLQTTGHTTDWFSV